MSDDETDTSENEVTPESVEAALDDAAESLAAAQTEADLDAVEATFEEIDADIEQLPPVEDDADDDPTAAASDRLSELRDELADARGPYADEVADQIAEEAETVRDTRWSDDGQASLTEAVGTFLAAAARGVGELPPEADPESVTDADSSRLATALTAVSDAVAESGLHPDEDADTIAELLSAADELTAAVDDAEAFEDLTTRDQLRAEGYFDVLGHYKDFPVEWAALKQHEEQGNTEMVLLALEKLNSEFLERHCMEALTRMNDEAAFEPVHERAQKRDKPAIRALGKMAADGAVETLVEYVDEESNPQLQKVTFTALGEIGAREAVAPLAAQLDTETDEVRPLAARALGMIGDTRAIEPLAAGLDHDHDSTRAAAAWALRQIGTETALRRAAEATDDDAYIVQAEAERAAEALETADPSPA